MAESDWDISVIRNLTHSLQIPDISDIRVNTYANLIVTVFKQLPNSFSVPDVESLLKTEFGLTNVSKMLIGKALFALSLREYNEESIITFNIEDFKITSQPIESPFHQILNIMIQKFKRRDITIDDQQKVLLQELLEITILTLSEMIEEVINSMYLKKNVISEHILSNIDTKWKDKIGQYPGPYIEKSREISNYGISILKAIFSDKDNISDILGLIGQILVFRSFICVDPQLEKLEKEIFSNSSILVDTNIIFAYLTQGSFEHDEIIWLLDNCKRIGLKFLINNPTILEYERTVLKDNIKHSMQQVTGSVDLNFADRDIPMGFTRKWSKIGSWNKYMKHLERGIELFSSKYAAEIVTLSEFPREQIQSACSRIEESIYRYKDAKAIHHDAILILEGHHIQSQKEEPPFPSFILTRDRKLFYSEKKMIEEDQIITPPQMVISPDHLIEFLMPFFYQTEDQSKIQSILGKMLSNAVISIDKKVFQYFAEYIAIETEMGASGAKRIMDITLDDYVSDELLQLKESSSPQDFDREFLGRIETKLDQLDESEELKSRLTRLIELAKTPPPKTPSGPKIQISFIGKLTQLLDTKLPVFCDPKPKSEKEYQREINKLLRAHDYYPNKDKDQVTFSTRGAIPDFTFNEERVAIEAKYIGDRTTVSDIIEQMAADITLYSKNYDIIIFTIYDGLSKITDVDFFKKDFEEFGHIIIVTK